MKRPHLKTAKFTNPEKSFITERYIVQNNADLKALLKEFPQLKGDPLSVISNWKDALLEGKTLLITDESYIGYPTYQFESPEGSEHPGSLIRITEDEKV